MPKIRVRSLAALVAAAATIFSMAAPAASAATQAIAAESCKSSYVEWDPDEGNGEGWSRCTPPYYNAFHRVVLLCSYDGDKFGPWVRAWEESRTTCTNGSSAYYAFTQVK
ncbi:hypothetical protein AB5J62_32420 [Amycolatopsis sp. cg5]|uniref:hypothetical protein n=1 Tax=Amycolatopsis sp. cg5 TaxID=3238802 RepID=UPI0035269B8D